MLGARFRGHAPWPESRLHAGGPADAPLSVVGPGVPAARPWHRHRQSLRHRMGPRHGADGARRTGDVDHQLYRIPVRATGARQRHPAFLRHLGGPVPRDRLASGANFVLTHSRSVRYRRRTGRDRQRIDRPHRHERRARRFDLRSDGLHVCRLRHVAATLACLRLLGRRRHQRAVAIAVSDLRRIRCAGAGHGDRLWRERVASLRARNPGRPRSDVSIRILDSASRRCTRRGVPGDRAGADVAGRAGCCSASRRPPCKRRGWSWC